VEEWILYDRSADVFLIFEIVDGDLQIRPSLVSHLPPVNQGWVLFVDYNGDGRKDVFNNGDRGVVVHKNTSAGSSISWQKVADPLRTTGFSGKINLIANAADVPAIDDIDNDGDYDILVYNFAIGGYIRYNRNFSMELYGHADSLEYEIVTREWGGFEECDCNLFAFYPETCADYATGRVMHPGGKALLTFDNDGDGDKDILVGHEQCLELYYYENYGDADSAIMLDYSGLYPVEEHPANLHIFPAGYYQDFNGDGVKDLLVSPNTETNIEYKTDFMHSSLLYVNDGSDTNPDFRFVQQDFVQDRMLDLGDNSVPWVIDVDADGDLDIIVAANGLWNGERYVGYLTLIENTGTAGSPEFTVAQQDFLGLSQWNLHDPRISLTDFNADGAVDMVYTGTVFQAFETKSYLLLNSAGPEEALSYDPGAATELDLPISLSDSPEFFDVDDDGRIDILVGKRNGALEYYRNTGTAEEASYELADGEFLGIGRDFTLERINLVARVADFDLNGRPDIVTTDYRGIGSIYYDFRTYIGEDDPIPITVQYENVVLDRYANVLFDQRASVAAGDIFDTGNQAIIAGGARGGLQILENLEAGEIPGDGGTVVDLKVYPNPAARENFLTLQSNTRVYVTLFDVLGRQVRAPFLMRKSVLYDISVAHLVPGMYILRAVHESGASSSKKVLVQD
jgi:hypothetical protein